jgi:hypothetical protein
VCALAFEVPGLPVECDHRRSFRRQSTHAQEATMSDEPIIPFNPKGKLEQLTREQLKAMYKAGQLEEIERARKAGHLDEVLGRIPKEAAPEPPTPVRS